MSDLDAQARGDDPGPGRAPARPPARRLTRNTANRVVFGVASGLGDYFGVDPVIFRIGFVVLTLAGGSGVLLYLLAWLVIPEGTGQPSVGARVTRGWSPWALVAIAVAAVVVLPALFGALVFGEGDAAVVVALVALAVLLLARRDDAWRDDDSRDHGSGSDDGPDDQPAAGRDPVGPAGAGTTATATATATGGRPPTTPATAAAATAPPARRRRPRGPSITRLTLSLLLVLAGGAALLDQADVLDVDPLDFLALALLVCGLGLLVGSRIGNARGLIPVALVLTAVVAPGATTDLELGGGVGDRLHQPLTVAELQDRYRLGAGELTVDLTGLPATAFAGAGLDLESRVGVGELLVVVPASVEVLADVRVGAGDIQACGVEDSGLGVERTIRCPGTGRGQLRLQARSGLGQVRIEQVTVAGPGPADLPSEELR